jgi:hypothetical protein
MPEALRRPFFIAAIVLSALVVLFELGTNVLPSRAVPIATASDAFTTKILNQTGNSKNSSLQADEPPGKAIPYMAMIDGLLLYALLIMSAPYLFTARLVSKVQGVITLFLSLFLIFLAFGRIILTFVELTIMVTLFLAAPFGTLAYLAIWGSFARGEASSILSVLMLLKLAFVVCLVLAQQRFLKGKSLMLLIVTSLLANIIVAFLYGFVPSPLASITDRIGALVNGILGIIWAIILLIGAIIAIIKALNLKRAAA